MDEIERLRNANPVAAEDVARLVAADRRTLLDALSNDPAGSAVDHGSRTPRPTRRSGLKVAGALAAAAAIVFAVLAVGGRLDGGRQVLETATADSCFRIALADEGSNDSQTTASQTNGASFDRSADLLSLHFDYAHLDDGHAALAAREVTTRLDLTPVVVAGTQAIASESYVHDYDTMMQAAWDQRWLDALEDRATARGESLGRWLQTLDAGGQVWVAEGGVSDFTAEVVREISQQRPDLDTAASIHVVQHSERNEAETRADDLAFVLANTSYERIADGNARNATANFNGSSQPFVEAALAGCHGEQWTVAFEYLAAAELDFSDTVTLMHILDVGVDEVGNADEFAAVFLTDPVSTR